MLITWCGSLAVLLNKLWRTLALAKSGKNVLCIDCDPQSSLSRSCKISDDPDSLEVTLSELMAYEMSGEDKDYILINNAIKQFENIDLIPSNISLSGTETALFNCMSRESVLKRTSSIYMSEKVLKLCSHNSAPKAYPTRPVKQFTQSRSPFGPAPIIIKPFSRQGLLYSSAFSLKMVLIP